MKIFQFITFCVKFQQVQNHCVIMFDKIDGFIIILLEGKVKDIIL